MPKKIHHVCGWSYPYLINPPCFGYADTMTPLHVGLKIGLRHRQAHVLQLTLVFIRSLKGYPSPVARILYANFTHFPQMNPGMHTTALVLSRFVSIPIRRNIVTVMVRVSCTHS